MRELDKLAQIAPDATVEKQALDISGWARKMRETYVAPLSTGSGKLKALAALAGLGIGAKLYHEGGKSPITPEQALELAHADNAETWGKMGHTKGAFLEEGLESLLWGLGGGAGGYLAGKKVIAPLISRREDQLRRLISQGEATLSKLQRIRKVSPVAAGAVGAFLLAALSARHAEKKQKERMKAYGNVPAYQYGLNPSDFRDISDPYAGQY